MLIDTPGFSSSPTPTSQTVEVNNCFLGNLEVRRPFDTVKINGSRITDSQIQTSTLISVQDSNVEITESEFSRTRAGNGASPILKATGSSVLVSDCSFRTFKSQKSFEVSDSSTLHVVNTKTETNPTPAPDGIWNHESGTILTRNSNVTLENTNYTNKDSSIVFLQVELQVHDCLKIDSSSFVNHLARIEGQGLRVVESGDVAIDSSLLFDTSRPEANGVDLYLPEKQLLKVVNTGHIQTPKQGHSLACQSYHFMNMNCTWCSDLDNIALEKLSVVMVQQYQEWVHSETNDKDEVAGYGVSWNITGYVLEITLFIIALYIIYMLYDEIRGTHANR